MTDFRPIFHLSLVKDHTKNDCDFLGYDWVESQNILGSIVYDLRIFCLEANILYQVNASVFIDS